MICAVLGNSVIVGDSGEDYRISHLVREIAHRAMPTNNRKNVGACSGATATKAPATKKGYSCPLGRREINRFKFSEYITEHRTK